MTEIVVTMRQKISLQINSEEAMFVRWALIICGIRPMRVVAIANFPKNFSIRFLKYRKMLFVSRFDRFGSGVLPCETD